MSIFPRFTSGRYGALRHDHMNALFDAADQMQAAAEAALDLGRRDIDKSREDVDGDDELLAECTGTADTQGNEPLDQLLSWIENEFKENTGFVVPTHGARDWEGMADIPFAHPGLSITAPQGFIRNTVDTEGHHLAVWQPATMVYACQIIEHRGVPPLNHTYGIQTRDNSIIFTGSETLTPIDRWPGVNYAVKPLLSDALLIVPTKNRSDLKLVAFETPLFASCPPDVPASPFQAPYPAVVSVDIPSKLVGQITGRPPQVVGGRDVASFFGL